MLDCLIDYIGLNYCSTGAYETPDSGLYLNTLPGITIESMDKIADREQITYLGVWNDVQRSAAIRFKNHVISEVTKCYQLNKDCNYEDLVCENKEKLAQSWAYLLANQLMVERIYSTRLNRFTTIDIEQARELKDFYEQEFFKELELAVKLMDVSGCELCCGGSIQSVTWIP
jgi:hypothetical protein